MPSLQIQNYTSEDYWNLPDGNRAELINGKLYNMAPPGRVHQELIAQLTKIIGNYIDANRGECKIYPSPFAVNLDADDKNWVEPDIVSPSSRKMDYSTKNAIYSDTGVREYWIIDPEKMRTTVYYYEEDAAPALYPFDIPIAFHIYPDLQITIDEIIK